MHLVLNLTGRTFGRLTPVGPTDLRRNRGVVWEFRCQCGATVYCQAALVMAGSVRSCGCLRHTYRVRSGMIRAQKYRVKAMLERVGL